MFLSVEAQVIRTASELSDFERHTSYVEMVSYLESIQETTTDMLLGSYGNSLEKRMLPYAIISRPLVTKPSEAITSGKPILVLAANVHGDERTLRESLLILLRELLDDNSDINALLDDLILIIVPSINVDGFSATQEGTRGNALGVDLNRDYMKLEHVTLVNYVRNILHEWQPHLIVDGHNGGSYPYNVNYQGPSHAASAGELTQLCDNEIFPAINKKMRKNGYKSWYYTQGDSTAWRTGGYDPRISRNYAGFLNSVGILLESPRGQTLETGVRSGLIAFETVLEYAEENAEKLMNTVAEARRETVEMGRLAQGDIPVQMKYEPEDYKVSYKIAIGPSDNKTVVSIHNADLIKKPLIIKARPRPYAYILEAKAVKAVELLKRHNIAVEQLREDTEISIESYILTGIERIEEYDHPSAAVVSVADETYSESRVFKKGSYIIRTGQYAGRLISHLLEPETNDNVIHWNTMDALLSKLEPEDEVVQNVQANQRGYTTSSAVSEIQEDTPPIIPIYKVMKPTAIPTSVLK